MHFNILSDASQVLIMPLKLLVMVYLPKTFLYNLSLLALSFFKITDLLHVLYTYVCDIVGGIYFVGKIFE